MSKVNAWQLKEQISEKGDIPRQQAYQIALERAREELGQLDPHDVIARSGARYIAENQGRGFFELPFIGENYTIGYPDSIVHQPNGTIEENVITQILLLHYLLHADGKMPADKWIAFREMLDGQMYDGVFKQRTCMPLARTFGSDLERFKKVARLHHGIPLTFGDGSYLFEVLPHLRLAIVLYLADEEFAANANVLFDAAAEHQLPIEDLIVLSEVLVHKLRKTPVS